MVKKKTLPAKRSLDFSSPSQKPLTQPKHLTPVAPASDKIITLTPSLQPLESTQLPVSNKRTAAELFGDIDDIDFENFELPSKKQKTEEENDLELIERIIQERKLRQILSEPSRIQNAAKPSYEAKDNISITIPRWAFFPLTNSDGDRIYVRLESEEFWEASLDTGPEKLSLQSTYASAWEEARKYLEKKEQQAIENQTSQEEPLPDEHETAVSTDLWVEKYRPSSYVELLSEEPVNRALLHWLHLWDKVVFKKEVKTKEPQQRNSFSKRTGQFQLTDKWKGKRELEPELDEDGRPHHKVALLCGPPGVGKTTLAHLLAKLAGYRPVELNASDERSTEAFRTALQNATLMRSVLDADRRPNCLILDEIDGAPIQTVELLVKWCTATTKKDEGGKKKGKSQPLRRPVIAICNDLYATSLRPLRPVSLVVSVRAAGGARLTARLVAVAARERLRVCPRALAALAARAAGDVRAALHVLSFLRARGRQLNVEDVENAAIGTKDCTKSFMQALQAVFTLNDQKNDILRTVYAAGEYDRIVDGIFENYLSARVDARLLIACETTSWLRLYDTMYAWTLRNQNYTLYGMLPYCIVRCHQLLASRAPQRVKFPLQAQEMSRKKAELDSILYSVWRGSAPGVVTSRDALRLDVLPLLPYLLTPTLRSANLQLCSESERKTLRTCAGALCDYGLHYVQQRTADGLYPYVLEPDIYRVAFFGSEERVRPPPAIRQAIAREQQQEIIRRNEEMANRVASKSKPKEGNPFKQPEKKSIEDKTMNKEVRLPNHLQRLQPKAVTKAAPQVHKDFFGRIVPIAQMQKQDAVADVISSSNVFYQYREGFNNAVRRNVRMRDLL
ncbi:chromosome transmission fidelity protein 18 homolog isoform X2 [Epargyreus clarus]